MAQSTSIIVPVFNEEKFVFKSISRLIKKLNQNNLRNYEIILVENGSRDNSRAEIDRLKQLYPKIIVVVTLPKPSYGQALKAGINKTKNDLVVIFNVDLWDVSFLMKGLPLCSVVDIVVGSKTLIASNDQRPLYRRITTYIFNNMLRLIFNFQGTDTHGIKIIKRTMAQKYVKKCRSRNELLDTEIILRACKNGCSYLELPITVNEMRPTRYNHVKRIQNTIIDMAIIFWTKMHDLYSDRR